MKFDQDLYRRLRELPKERLWGEEVPRFNEASPRERIELVALIRAVGKVFSRFGTQDEKSAVRSWLITLLRDPQEKIRRYALAALPKIGADELGEREMLSLLGDEPQERERRHLGRALEKVGGVATLAAIEQGGATLPGITRLKLKAKVTRRQQPGHLQMETPLPLGAGTRIFLRCRRGLEPFVRDEAVEVLAREVMDVEATEPGCVTLAPHQPLSLARLYALRCFATVGFDLGTIESGIDPGQDQEVESLARCIASTRAVRILLAGTEGTPRYRLEVAGHGHQRGLVRRVADRAYALCPEILNDSRQSLWSVVVIPSDPPAATAPGQRTTASVELRPRLHPDPRLFYRQDDIDAASHPPLAACLVRLAEIGESETVWDPFCGSGLELVESALGGGVTLAYGTDLNARAIDVAQANFAAAQLTSTKASFTVCDFREARRATTITAGSLSLIISNPPLGRRVRVPDLRGLFADLFAEASWALRAGGRLVLVNPLRQGPEDPSLELAYRTTVDLGGFDCRLEKYRKVIPRNLPRD